MTSPESKDGSADHGCRVRKRTKFPEVCVKCGAVAGLIARRRKLAYIPPSIYVAFLFGCVGWVLGIVLCVAARRTTELTVSTCSRCTRAWDRASRRPAYFLAGSLLATLAAAALVFMLHADRIWLAIGLGLLATSVGPIALHFSGRSARVWAKSIDENTATLLGLHPAVVAELERRSLLVGIGEA